VPMQTAGAMIVIRVLQAALECLVVADLMEDDAARALRSAHFETRECSVESTK